ncbi:MAG TPA: 16S rRNA (uracil(1498)-N(3))-methyltransferase [Saprospiraceae bacterium]|nr:16S rRNA (uracil(1498)-N(3))-methyltransferase [Saprospiraceae bacterium]
MNIFYAQNIDNSWIRLEAEEARHCVQVLRKKIGDCIYVVDGNGNFYECELTEAGKKNCLLSIQKTIQAYHQRSFYLHIAIAPTKNINRLEWFLEKATEIGIDEITPLLCFHSERKIIKTQRLNRVLLTAMKQSLKAKLPLLNPMTPFKDFIHNRKPTQQSFIAHCQQGNENQLKEKYKSKQSVCILIGPEGDFSEAEILLALSNGFEAITLGPNRLRTETAGIVACHTVNLLSE